MKETIAYIILILFWTSLNIWRFFKMYTDENTCPKCGKEKKIVKEGYYQCSDCNERFYATQKGKIFKPYRWKLIWAILGITGSFSAAIYLIIGLNLRNDIWIIVFPVLLTLFYCYYFFLFLKHKKKLF